MGNGSWELTLSVLENEIKEFELWNYKELVVTLNTWFFEEFIGVEE